MHRTPTKHRLVALGASIMILAAVPAAAQASGKHAMKHNSMKHHHAMKHHAMKKS
jgi:hypothetical protein